MEKEMSIQADRKFLEEKDIKKPNKKYIVHMFSSHIFRGKVFAGKKNIRELKNLPFKTKSLDKKSGQRIRPNKLIEKATSNLNKIKCVKYGFVTEKIELKSIESDQFRDKYHRCYRNFMEILHNFY